MAKILRKHKFTILTLFLISFFILGQCYKFSRKLSSKSFGLKTKKLSHLHFYFHEIITGDHPTAARVAELVTTNTSKTFFGTVIVADNPLTMGPELTSKIVGRAQGMYALCDLNEFSLLMVLNYVFLEGEYNGSNFSILGRNPFLSTPVREMPIVGGSGLFRFARGYALAKTYFLNSINGGC